MGRVIYQFCLTATNQKNLTHQIYHGNQYKTNKEFAADKSDWSPYLNKLPKEKTTFVR